VAGKCALGISISIDHILTPRLAEMRGDYVISDGVSHALQINGYDNQCRKNPSPPAQLAPVVSGGSCSIAKGLNLMVRSSR